MNRSESTKAATILRSSERIMLVPNFERDILFVIHRITTARCRFPPSAPIRKVSICLGQEINLTPTLLYPDPLLFITRSNTRTPTTSIFLFVSAFLINGITRDRLPASSVRSSEIEKTFGQVYAVASSFSRSLCAEGIREEGNIRGGYQAISRGVFVRIFTR